PNLIDADTSPLDEYLYTLSQRRPAPCLGRGPRLGEASAENVAQYLEPGLLR
ncbi:dethiobiotin synthase, partial [Pseudomonas syringae pv. tagetis]